MLLQRKVAARREEQNAGVKLDITHFESTVPVSLQKYLGFGINRMWEGLGAGGWLFVFVGEGYCDGGVCSSCYMGHDLLCQKPVSAQRNSWSETIVGLGQTGDVNRLGSSFGQKAGKALDAPASLQM